MSTLKISIDLDNDAFADGGREVSRILRKLAGKIDTYGTEYVNCDVLRDINGNNVGDVWLATEDDSDARYLAAMALFCNAYETVSDDGNDSPEATAAARLSSSVGLYLSAIGHPQAPAWANRRLNK